ncbi:MAG: Gfo/Idh/MocA family oxidoreductase [Alphaproteobacteria bacterium]|nr:Gfo/Idh/MocA family oxidoreductase [Alphaproteobacteria bacterium]
MSERLRWGVLGYGRAGRARARAILDDPRCALVGAWRGAPEPDGVPRFDTPAALMAACDAVAVCTPNGLHAAGVRAALERGLHVVVEFPLAGSAQEARRLLELADARGRVLHVEHIELLDGAARALRAARGSAALVDGELRFTSGQAGWLADPALALGVASRNVARLHRLWDLLGPLRCARVEARSFGRLRATLEAAGGQVRLDCTHAPGLPRATALTLRFADGACLEQRGRAASRGGAPLAVEGGPPLFAQDHALAMSEILKGAPPRPDRDQLVGVLELADDLRFRALATP